MGYTTNVTIFPFLQVIIDMNKIQSCSYEKCVKKGFTTDNSLAHRGPITVILR